MAKTAKGLETAAKKARARFSAWQNRYFDLLGKFYVVNGNPAREWIVGSSWTLLDDIAEDLRDDCFFSIAARKYCDCASDYFIAEKTRIWRKTHNIWGDWFAGCTAYVLRRMKTIERRMKYWQDKAEAAEDALEDLLDLRHWAEFDAQLDKMSVEELKALKAQYSA